MEETMDTQDLIHNLEADYYATITANPDWKAPTLFDYLVSRGVDADDIWKYSPNIGWWAGKTDPEWL